MEYNDKKVWSESPEELSARDNLPDYRTPQDQGFGGYNTSWRTPDFKAFCEEKLK